MIVASIDIGTNTVLLLIAEVDKGSHKLIPLHNEYRMPRIGQSTIKTRLINQDKVKLFFEVLEEYDIIIRQYHCDKVLVIGTNALRIAENSSDIIREIKRRFEYDLEIITGDKEAEYAFFGAISNLTDFKSAMVIDIGGGSTEIVFGNKFKIISKRSIQIGSVSATEQFLKQTPPMKTEIENLQKEIRKMFSGLNGGTAPNLVIAVAGTATTLACMKLGLKEFREDKVEKSSISNQEMKLLINELIPLTPSSILKNYGPIMQGREDVIFAGAIILSEIMELMGIAKLIVSSRGIRHGAIIKYLNKLN